MSVADFLPDDLYLYRQDAPHAAEARPIGQGDVFVDIPLVRAAQRKDRHPTQFTAPVKSGDKSLGIVVSHPCSSRSRSTHALKESVLLAPVVRCPDGFEAPWTGYYEYFPLPGLREDIDYVADLSAICPVRSAYLEGQRVACLTDKGLAALFYRLAVNFLRLDRIPDDYSAEAERLCYETNLWELWTRRKGTEEGFQAWLDEEFEGEALEDETGNAVLGSEERFGISRRAGLRWHYEEIQGELEQELDQE
ncbi:MAG TPA: hypothetical protein VMF57_14475 [Solirubrobacteraceae bacterium]|nr:hypothetical protein [Solirubrobacteraceae bacterium]